VKPQRSFEESGRRMLAVAPMMNVVGKNCRKLCFAILRPYLRDKAPFKLSHRELMGDLGAPKHHRGEILVDQTRMALPESRLSTTDYPSPKNACSTRCRNPLRPQFRIWLPFIPIIYPG
jgi:hypothetical protein